MVGPDGVAWTWSDGHKSVASTAGGVGAELGPTGAAGFF
jgi:hypothetical protein